MKQIIYPLIRNPTTLYLRYIDDIILLCTKSENELLTFFEKLNQQHSSIKFEMKYSRDKIEFLDNLIYKYKNNNIQTTLYKKPKDRQNYIHSKSAHPFSLKNSIAYSKALRLKQISSTTGEYEKHTDNLKKQLFKKVIQKLWSMKKFRKQSPKTEQNFWTKRKQKQEITSPCAQLTTKLANRKDVKVPKAVPVYKHFNQTGHNFNLHAKFIIIEQLQDNIQPNTKRETKNTRNYLDQKIKDINTIRTQSRPKLNPRNAVYIVQFQLPYCIWNSKSAMTSSSYLTSDLFKLISN